MSGGLAQVLTELLAGRPDGLSCDEIAGRLRRRRTDVLAVLRTDLRFEHNGRTHGSRWRTCSWDGMGRVENAQGATELPWSYLDAGVPVLLVRGPESE